MNQETNSGVCKMNCDTDGDGWPEKNIDLDGDGTCDINCFNDDGICIKCCTASDGKVQIIAPRSYGEYTFSVKNTTKGMIKYKVTFEEENKYNINLLYRVKRNNLYLSGWKKASEINNNEVVLPVNGVDNYTLEWFWKDSPNDTELGELDLATYTIKINITAKGE